MMQKFTLPDGRTLSFAEHGHANGRPVLFCHGLPGSRNQISETMSAAARELSFRIIAPDRLGFGFSSPAPESGYVGWTADAAILLDHLRIRSCHIIGFSIGAPCAVACAAALPARIERLSLVSAMAPNVWDMDVQSRLPAASRDVFEIARSNPEKLSTILQGVAPDAAGLLAVYEGSMSAPDNRLLGQPDVSAGFLSDCEETLRQGHDAVSTELIRYVRPWEIDLEAIRIPVDIWHGAEDINAPPAMAYHLASLLPGSRLRWVPGEGHLCLLTQWKNILGGFQ